MEKVAEIAKDRDGPGREKGGEVEGERLYLLTPSPGLSLSAVRRTDARLNAEEKERGARYFP